MSKPMRYLWLDAETTDLDKQNCHILEIGYVATDVDLNPLESSTILLRQGKATFERLAQFPAVLQMHSANGLYSALVNTPPEKLPTLEEAEEQLLAVIDRYAPEEAPITLAGSGVGHFDLGLLQQKMPRLAARFTYFVNDVNAARRRYLEVTGTDIVPPLPAKEHRGLADVQDDLRHAAAFDAMYRQHAATRSTTKDPAERALGALALVELYGEYEVFDSDLGEIHNAQAADDLKHLLRTATTADTVAGLIDLAYRLAGIAAEHAGTSPQGVLDTARTGYLADMLDISAEGRA